MTEHLSHSQLTSWLRCGKAYELNRIMKAPRQPAVWTAAGVALHETLDNINRSYVAGEDLNIKKTWDASYESTLSRIENETGVSREHWKCGGRVSKEKPQKENSVWWGHEGYRELMEYQQWLRTSGWKVTEFDGIVMSEFETTAIFGDVEVKGFLDAVMKAPDGSLVVVDAKSGTRVPSNVTQLALYAVALKKTLGVDIKHGAFFMTRKAEMTDTFDLTKYTDKFFTSLFSGLAKAKEEKIFLPNPGEACFTCDVRSSCFTVGGHDAYKYDSLHPNFSGVSLDKVSD